MDPSPRTTNLCGSQTFDQTVLAGGSNPQDGPNTPPTHCQKEPKLPKKTTTKATKEKSALSKQKKGPRRTKTRNCRAKLIC